MLILVLISTILLIWFGHHIFHSIGISKQQIAQQTQKFDNNLNNNNLNNNCPVACKQSCKKDPNTCHKVFKGNEKTGK